MTRHSAPRRRRTDVPKDSRKQGEKKFVGRTQPGRGGGTSLSDRVLLEGRATLGGQRPRGSKAYGDQIPEAGQGSPGTTAAEGARVASGAGPGKRSSNHKETHRDDQEKGRGGGKQTLVIVFSVLLGLESGSQLVGAAGAGVCGKTAAFPPGGLWAGKSILKRLTLGRRAPAGGGRARGRRRRGRKLGGLAGGEGGPRGKNTGGLPGQGGGRTIPGGVWGCRGGTWEPGAGVYQGQGGGGAGRGTPAGQGCRARVDPKAPLPGCRGARRRQVRGGRVLGPRPPTTNFGLGPPIERRGRGKLRRRGGGGIGVVRDHVADPRGSLGGRSVPWVGTRGRAHVAKGVAGSNGGGNSGQSEKKPGPLRLPEPLRAVGSTGEGGRGTRTGPPGGAGTGRQGVRRGRFHPTLGQGSGYSRVVRNPGEDGPGGGCVRPLFGSAGPQGCASRGGELALFRACLRKVTSFKKKKKKKWGSRSKFRGGEHSAASGFSASSSGKV